MFENLSLENLLVISKILLTVVKLYQTAQPHRK